MAENQNDKLIEFKEKQRLLQFKLMDGEEIQGRVNWFDNFNISISVLIRKRLRK